MGYSTNGPFSPKATRDTWQDGWACGAAYPAPVRRNRAITVLFYAGLLVVIVGVLAGLLPRVLPGGLADRIGRNSEGFVLALLLALWIQFARPRLAGTARQWPITLAAAAGCVAVTVILLVTDAPSRLRTLNETFLAAAVIIPYLQLRRPLSPRLALGLSVGVLAVIVLGQRAEVVTLLAETLGALLLVPIAFDVVDRGILDPYARTSRGLRYAWYAVLVLAPIVFSLLQYGVGFTGLFGEATRYSVRIVEAFVCMLLVELYFAEGLGRKGRAARPG